MPLSLPLSSSLISAFDPVTPIHTTFNLVYIPPGWVHAVDNMGPNVKLAFDVYDPYK
jgi:hypothetical protein